MRIEFRKQPWNQSGQSLISVLVSMAMTGILLLILLQMNSEQTKSMKYFMQKSSIQETKNLLTQLLTANSVCDWQFATAHSHGYINETAPASSADFDFTAIYTGTNTSSPPLLDITNTDLSGLRLSSIKFTNIALQAGSQYQGDLVISFDSETAARPIAPLKITKYIFVDSTAGSPTARPVLSCATLQEPTKGFCTTTASFDNNNSYVCPTIAGFNSRKLTGVFTPANAIHTSCCYIPTAPGSPGWCSQNVEGWLNSFSGCGADTADYIATHVSGMAAGQNDSHVCCFIPRTKYPGGPGANTFGTLALRADSQFSNPLCGGPYDFYEIIPVNMVAPGVGRTVSCTFSSR